MLCQSAMSGSSPRVRGTRSRRSCTTTRTAVHPRVCGELGGILWHGDQKRRFIPACAGNSAPRLPRARPAFGSSPRVRGTLRRALWKPTLPRFIPACAGNSSCASPIRAGSSVHPRVCGELGATGELQQHLGGSSPRVRGTHWREDGGHLLCRFIPACAGNSAAYRAGAGSSAVHPRVCGELPLLRGSAARRQRFIPACAGNSPKSAKAGLLPAVHPRVCGELPSRHARSPRNVGSSPRVRGTRFSWTTNRCSEPVHPRVCGELDRGVPLGHSVAGSSPRVRGTRCPSPAPRRPPRFIPACAGNSFSQKRRLVMATVHPRVCGELGSWGQFAMLVGGSSPRVRGTRVPLPAFPCPTPVHPRVCGELTRVMLRAVVVDGSSPRVRGTPTMASSSNAPTSVHPRVCGELLPDASARASRRRFIPACAGNSPDDPGM